MYVAVVGVLLINIPYGFKTGLLLFIVDIITKPCSKPGINDQLSWDYEKLITNITKNMILSKLKIFFIKYFFGLYIHNKMNKIQILFFTVY